MKRQKPSKPRTTTLTMDMGKPVQINSFSVSAEGSFKFLDVNGNSLQPERTILERGYERAKGSKVLSRVPVSSVAPISLDPNLALQKYDTIFAMDTNTRQVHGQEVSIAAFILGKWMQRSPTLEFGFQRMAALEFHNVDCHPDLLALKHLVLQMENEQFRQKAGRIAIIMDSHLGNFTKIVSRQLPILDDCYFPECADLVYASDAACDSLANMLLQAADREANTLLQKIEVNACLSTSQGEEPEHCSYFRIRQFCDAG